MQLTAPTIRTTFGGLDMRKTKTYTVTTEADGTDSATEQAITMNANHLLSTGDMLTYDSDTSDMDGTYIVDKKDADEIDLPTLATTTGTSKTNPVYTNQWEAIASDTSSNANMGEIRAGFTNWDKGDSAANVLRLSLIHI